MPTESAPNSSPRASYSKTSRTARPSGAGPSARDPHPPAADAAGPSLSRSAGEGHESGAGKTLSRPGNATGGEGGPSAKRLVGEGAPKLSEIIETLASASRAEVGAHLGPWLDGLDATGRWALLKLVTGALRIGVSARLAKTALSEWSGVELDRIEEVWHGLEPPYLPLFDWLEGRAEPPDIADLPTFCASVSTLRAKWVDP